MLFTNGKTHCQRWGCHKNVESIDKGYVVKEL